jgi:hypothetical protein
VDDVERTRVRFNILDVTNATSVSSLSDDAQISHIEGQDVQDLAGGNIDLDNIVGLDDWVRVADGAAIVCDKEGNLLLAEFNLYDAAQLEGLLLVRDSVKSVPTLGIKDKSKLVASLGDLNDVHEASREVGVGADATINLDVLLHADHLGLLTSQGVLESVSEDQDERQGCSQGVRSLGWTGSLHIHEGVGQILQTHINYALFLPKSRPSWTTSNALEC